MSASPSEASVLSRPAPERTLVALGLAIGLGCWSIPLSMVGETSRSPVHEFIVALVCALAALYGSASSKWLDRKEWGDWPRSLIRGIQLVAPFLVAAGWLLLVFRNVGAVLAAVALSSFVWWVSADVARLLSRGVEGAEERMAGTKSTPLRQLAVRFLLGGTLLFLAGAVSQAPDVLRQQIFLPGTRWMIALGGYGLSGVALLSYARYVQVRQLWQSRSAAITPETGTGWMGAMLTLLGLAAGIAALVWLSLSTHAANRGLAQVVRAGQPTGEFIVRLLSLASVSPFTIRATPGVPQEPHHTPGLGHHPASGADLSLLIQGLVLLTLVAALFLYRYRKELRSYWNTAGWVAKLKAWLWPLLWLWSLLGGGARGAGHLLAAVAGTAITPITQGMGRRSSSVLFPGRLAPRQRVLYYYARMLQRATQRGIARRAAQTPIEFGRELATRLPEAAVDVESLTGEFMEARYSRHLVDEGVAGRVRHSYGRIRAVLRRSGDA